MIHIDSIHTLGQSLRAARRQLRILAIVITDSGDRDHPVLT
ncbi:hypothetical protein [Acidiferrobacter sp.]|nr:hypothetical protein [Acidiferrobacter sp.]